MTLATKPRRKPKLDIAALLADIAPPETLAMDVYVAKLTRAWLQGFLRSLCSDHDWRCAADCLLVLDGHSLQSDEIARVTDWLRNASDWRGVGVYTRFVRGVMIRGQRG